MAKPVQNRTTPLVLWLVGIVGVILIVLAIRSLTREKVAVRVAPVTHQNLLSTVSTNGKVEPIEPYQAHAPGPGRIENIYVAVNEAVKPGTLLIRLSDADARSRLATAQAAVASAQVSALDLGQGGSPEERQRFAQDISSARAELQRSADDLLAEQQLQAKGAASAGEVTRAQQRVATARAALASAEARTTGRYSGADRASASARLADARASVAAAQASLAAVDIRSPIAGTVYSIPFSNFDFVPSGSDDLLDIADLSRIQVRAYFDEPEIGKLARGQAVKIVWDARPNRVWHGHIELAPTTVITYGTRNVGESMITIDDAHGDLPPNSNVTVTVTTAQSFNVLSIPREALHTEGASNYVYRIVDGKLARTTVQLGTVVSITNVEVSGGLSDKDVVVLGPAVSGQELTSGLEVKRVQ